MQPRALVAKRDAGAATPAKYLPKEIRLDPLLKAEDPEPFSYDRYSFAKDLLTNKFNWICRGNNFYSSIGSSTGNSISSRKYPAI